MKSYTTPIMLAAALLAFPPIINAQNFPVTGINSESYDLLGRAADGTSTPSSKVGTITDPLTSTSYNYNITASISNQTLGSTVVLGQHPDEGHVWTTNAGGPGTYDFTWTITFDAPISAKNFAALLVGDLGTGVWSEDAGYWYDHDVTLTSVISGGDATFADFGYGLTGSSGSPSGFTVINDTGNTFSATFGYAGVEIDSQQSFGIYGISEDKTFTSISTTLSGIGSFDLVHGWGGVQYNTTLVPEPSGALLIGLAGSLALFRRRRRA